MTPIVLVVAGIDPSGGAGLVADVATVGARGLRAAAVATALTEQDSVACHAVRAVAADDVARDLRRVVEDLPIAAIKIGMLATGATARVVADVLQCSKAPLVLDPVLVSTSGALLLDDAGALVPLLRRAALVTPNVAEAAALARIGVPSLGNAVLYKGGHRDGDPVVDEFVDGEGAFRLTSPRRPGPTPRGTGCALATEIACALATGLPLRDAVRVGHDRLAARLAGAAPVGKGRPHLAPA